MLGFSKTFYGEARSRVGEGDAEDKEEGGSQSLYFIIEQVKWRNNGELLYQSK